MFRRQADRRWKEEVNKAARLIAEREHEPAIALLTQVLEHKPGLPEAHLWLGEARRAQGQPEAAAESYQAAYHRARRSPEVAFQAAAALAELYTGLGQHEAAIQWYEQALTLRPSNNDLRWKRFIAQCHLAEAEWPGDGWEQQGLTPAAGEPPESGGWDPFTEMSADQALTAANEAFETGRYAEAIDLYTLARRSDRPESTATAYSRRGRCFFAIHAYACAIESLDHYLLLHPDDSSGYFNRGLYYESMACYQEALVNYNRSLELLPGDEAARRSRDRVLAKIKQESAVTGDNVSRATDALHPEGSSHVALYFARRGRLDLAEDELAYARRLDRVDPVWCTVAQGALHLRRRAVAQAVADFTELVEGHQEDPGVIEGYLNLSWIQNDLNLAVKLDQSEMPQLVTLPPQSVNLDEVSLEWRLIGKGVPAPQLGAPGVTPAGLSLSSRTAGRRPSSVASGSLRLGRQVVWGREYDVWVDLADRQGLALVMGGDARHPLALIRQMVAQDLEAGAGICVIDCQGNLIRDVLRLIPSRRLDDTLLLDPTNVEHPVGFNPFECATENERRAMAEVLPDLLTALLKPGDGPETDYLRGVLGEASQQAFQRHEKPGPAAGELERAIQEALAQPAAPTDPDLTLVEFPKVVRRVALNQTSTRDLLMLDRLQAGLTALSELFRNPQIRRVVGQLHSGFDVYDFVRKRGVILARLPTDALGEVGSGLLGWLLLLRLCLVARHFNQLVTPDEGIRCPDCGRPATAKDLCECGVSLSAVVPLTASVDWYIYFNEPRLLPIAIPWCASPPAPQCRVGIIISRHAPIQKELAHFLTNKTRPGLVIFRLTGSPGREVARRLPVSSRVLELLLDYQALARWPAGGPTVMFVPTPDRARPGSDQTEVARRITRQNYSRDRASVDSEILEHWRKRFKEIPGWERDQPLS